MAETDALAAVRERKAERAKAAADKQRERDVSKVLGELTALVPVIVAGDDAKLRRGELALVLRELEPPVPFRQIAEAAGTTEPNITQAVLSAQRRRDGVSRSGAPLKPVGRPARSS